MGLILIHGEIVFELMASALLAFGVFSALALWLWLRPPRAPVLPAALYLFLGLAVCIAFVADADDNYFVTAVAITFPWSVILIIVSTLIGTDLKGLLLLGVVLNAVLIYAVAWAINRRLGRPS